MAEPLSFIFGTAFLFLVIKLLIINQIITRLGQFVFNEKVLIVALILIALYLFIPDVVLPYYELIGNYLYDGIVTIFDLLWDFLREILGVETANDK